MISDFREGDRLRWWTMRFEKIGFGNPQIIFGLDQESINSFPTEQDKDCIAAYELFLGRSTANPDQSDFVRGFERQHGLGFGQLIRLIPHDGKAYFREYAINIPRMEHDCGPCKECGGSGKIDDCSCIDCDGGGRKTAIRFDEAMLALSNVCVLSNGIFGRHPEEALPKHLREPLVPNLSGLQLFTLNVHCVENSFVIHGSISPQFTKWLQTSRAREERMISLVQQAMYETYIHMVPSYSRFGDRGFRFWYPDMSTFILEVPGQSSVYVKVDDGVALDITFHDTHIDSCVQAFSFLAGLAALSGEAQKDLG